MFVAVQDSCTYAGPKLCLNDHYLLRRSVYGGQYTIVNATFALILQKVG